MSEWVKRKKEFEEGADALAEDVNTEFDYIAELFNGLFQAGRAQASAKTVLGTSYTAIAGTEKSITVARASLLLVVATWDITAAANALFTGNLEIDAATQTPEATADAAASNFRGTVTQTFEKELSTGAHTVKMVGKRNGEVEIFDAENTGYLYLVIPDPEP